jgi:hypothetical protein
VVYVTSNEIDEVADQMWFQLVPDITISGGDPTKNNGDVQFPIASRGGKSTDSFGDVWGGASGCERTDSCIQNPALTIDNAETSLNDVVVAAFNLTRVKNKKNQLIYAPEVKITATNGGLSALASASQKAAGFVDFKNRSAFNTTTTFGYTYYQDLVFMGTQPGLTTWKVQVGNWSYSFSQSYVAP